MSKKPGDYYYVVYMGKSLDGPKVQWRLTDDEQHPLEWAREKMDDYDGRFIALLSWQVIPAEEYEHLSKKVIRGW